MADEIPRLLDIEARVLGVLIEKSLTMPDSYPLSLNALTNGANQKSNRHPVTSHAEGEVFVALEGLTVKGLAGRVVGAGSRVEKFRHAAADRLRLAPGPLAVLAELLLRGPQAPGELRARVHRMVATASLAELAPHIETLVEKGYAMRLAPAPGSRAERYVQKLCPELHPLEGASAAATPAPAQTPASSTPALEARLEALEQEVARLRAELDELRASLGG